VKPVLLAVIIAACGGGHSAPTHPHASAGAHPDAVAQAGVPDDHECDELIAHAIDLAVSERHAAKPTDPAPSDDDRHAIEHDVRAQLGAACHTLPRAHYSCAMAASTLDALDACDR
jgi:hypothetical protein